MQGFNEQPEQHLGSLWEVSVDLGIWFCDTCTQYGKVVGTSPAPKMQLGSLWEAFGRHVASIQETLLTIERTCNQPKTSVVQIATPAHKNKVASRTLRIPLKSALGPKC